MGKSTISMAIFHSKMLVHQGVTNLGTFDGPVLQVMMDCMCEAGREVLKDPEKVKDPVSFITAILSLKQKSPPRDPMGLKMIEVII